MEVALKAANAAGGVDGYKFAWKVYDSGSSPSGAINAVRLAVSDHVFAVLINSAQPDSALPSLVAAGIPTIGDGDGAGYSGPPDMFSVTGDSFLKNTTAWWEPLVQEGKTRIAIPGGTINASVTSEWERQLPLGGGSLCFGRTGIDGTNTASITAVAHEIIAAHCQGVVSPTLYPGTLQLQIALNQLGAEIPVVDLVDSGPAVIQQAGSSADNLIYTNNTASPYATRDPGVVQFLSDMKTYAPSQTPYCGRCMIGYIMAKWFLQSLGQINGTATQPGLIAALNSTKNYTANNLIGPINEPEFHSTPDPCLSFQVIQNGHWVPLTNTAFPFVCGKAVS
jgi:ABC-type branched-subunit amino acid transport system substrate-binding protein